MVDSEQANNSNVNIFVEQPPESRYGDYLTLIRTRAFVRISRANDFCVSKKAIYTYCLHFLNTIFGKAGVACVRETEILSGVERKSPWINVRGMVNPAYSLIIYFFFHCRK